ncbi:hypothetical protein MLD38_010330 [Melastoma candidum]|uniref:Uncharacterized protein n=1 Tax=Melastoma candidum TaxID=119954 RepID=A0ACB9QZG2_9MYRT|nr:hypothetical protein MLD38_010330 [Melastoma candidum]
MAAKVTPCFLNQSWTGLNRRSPAAPFSNSPPCQPRFLSPPYCRMRPRSFSSQSRRPQRHSHVKKRASEKPPPPIVVNGEMEMADGMRESGLGFNPGGHGDGDNGGDEVVIDVENVNAKQQPRMVPAPEGQNNLAIIGDAGQSLPGIQYGDLIGMIKNAEKNILLLNQARVRTINDLQSTLAEKEALQGELTMLEMKMAETEARIKAAAQEKLYAELLEDQIEELRNELLIRGKTQHNVHEQHKSLLNQGNSPSNIDDANTLCEELSNMKSENMNLKNDLQALTVEFNSIKETISNVKAGNMNLNNDLQALVTEFNGTKETISDLKTGDMNLKYDLQTLTAEFNSIKENVKHVPVLDRQQSDLLSALKELELKFSFFKSDDSRLYPMKSEYKALSEKVEHFQALLDKAARQADQAILELQENYELKRKVDILEESLEEVRVYKLSAERFQQSTELVQQKMKLLEERIQKSDEEVNSYVQLYQESVKEFQETLTRLKEESQKRALNEPVDHMPQEFWSRLLLMVDGWLLEKKISADDAKLLREMVWKKDRQIYDTYLACKNKNEHDTMGSFLRLISTPTRPGLYIIHIAAEVAPVAKVGGLGDVVSGLSKSLQKRGHLVEIVLPKYDCMQYDRIHDLKAMDAVVESYFDGRLYRNKIWAGIVDGLPVYFIEPLHPDKFFWRGKFYGEPDDFKRFSFFSRAALELLLQAGKKPDIIHCHDWQTAFVAPLYWDLYAPKGLNTARICFTCHNFEYQGTAPASELQYCGLDVHQLNRPDRMQDHSAEDWVNPVKGAIVFSNIVTTVSTTYAQEVQTAEGGKGLDATLNFHSKKFIGILNGIDTDAWNPSTDGFLEVQYNSNDIQGKDENKYAIRRQLGLSYSSDRKPLVGCITRLVPQKGVHLIRHALYRTLELGGQFVLLGSSPVPHIQSEFEGIARQFQNHDDIRLVLKYDDSLSHRIYAASDVVIIPSIFEPCGLTQMIAMRYGSIPVARKTGGLNDSVFDVDDETVPPQFRNGFTFFNANEQDLSNALERAVNHYKRDAEGWQQLVRKVMSIDFSWDVPASQYEELYWKSVARARASQRL